jgi:anti-sigma factor RsiW
MTNNGRPIGEEELHAYVDDRLDPDRRQTVERYLQAHPEAGARIRRWQESSEALRQALAGRASEPIPASLSLPHLSALRTRRRTPLRMVAGVALALMVGTGAGWVMRGPPGPSGLTALAMEAASGYRATAYNHLPLEFAADRQADLVSWTSRQFGSPMPPPDLTRSGYRLLGGRIALTVQGAGCLYVYDNGSGSRLTLFLRRMHGRDLEAPMQPLKDEDVSGFAWARDGIGFSLVSNQSTPTLHEISDHIRNEMTGGV